MAVTPITRDQVLAAGRAVLIVVAVILLAVAVLTVGAYLLLGFQVPHPGEQNALLLVGAIVGAGTLAAAWAATHQPLYRASLIRTAVWLPGIITILSIMLYLVLATSGPESPLSGDGLLAVLIGSGLGFTGWLIYSALNPGFSGPESANARSHSQLMTRRYLLGKYGDASKGRLDQILSETDERWILATGYLDAWELVHRAEEEQLRKLPYKQLVPKAFHDWMRLRGSNIPQAEALRDKVRTAVSYLDADATAYFIDPTGVAKVEPPKDVTTAQKDAARDMIANVRATINVYREERYDRIVRARNALVMTTAFTALVAYLGLALALIGGVPPAAVVAASSFFVVGAVVGLLIRLRTDATRGVAMEDMGLSTARLLHTPLLSGIAAIAGVALIALAAQVSDAFATASGALAPEGAAIGAPEATPAPSGEVAKGEGGATETSLVTESALVEIFDVGRYPLGLVIAAVFGFSPALLLRGLQRHVDQYKLDLAASEASSSNGGED